MRANFPQPCVKTTPLHGPRKRRRHGQSYSIWVFWWPRERWLVRRPNPDGRWRLIPNTSLGWHELVKKYVFPLEVETEEANNHSAPAWGGVSGSRTPAWKNDGSRTSNPYAEGNRTAYGGIGNRTPAWNSASKTPYDSGSGFDAFASGSRTPAWGAANTNTGNRTPAWGSSSHSHDQRDFDDAPTPGGNYSAPTPGAYAAPTPGAPTPGGWPESAPTPGAFNAPTPGGPTPAPYDAPTPAMGGSVATPGVYGGNDGGPRYADSPSP